MRRYTSIHLFEDELILDSGCEPLTPDDIAEVVVFNAARRENVVVADTLVFPNHQVRLSLHTGIMVKLAIAALFC